MLIDWFTVGAQVLNFLVLVWLLRRFLYKPILAAIDARETAIAAKLADAAAKQAKAEAERVDFENKNKAFEGERNALLIKATDEAKTEHDHLLADAHKEADDLRLQQATALRNDGAKLESAITHLAQGEVFGIARKTLADLSTASLEAQMSDAFLRRLRAMDGAAKATLGAALTTATEPAHLRSAFDLPAEQKGAIQTALNESFSAAIPLQFETVPDTICGIELTANGQKLSWSIADYLTSLEQKVNVLLAAPAEAT
jgi:F-type H+-transporting ATPase subunit b